MYVECIYSVKNAECLRHVVCEVCIVSMNFQRVPCFSLAISFFSFLTFFFYVYSYTRYLCVLCARICICVAYARACVCVYVYMGASSSYRYEGKLIY